MRYGFSYAPGARAKVCARTFLGLFCFLGLAAQAAETALPPASQVDPAIEGQVTSDIAAMTLEEKITLLSGDGFMGTRGVPRLGIPPIFMNDGPAGISSMTEIGGRGTTAFPAPVNLATTWNPDLMHRSAGALAAEVSSIGRHMLLGPCLNIHRLPQGGRNFESFSEDPWLAARMAAEYIQGVQGEGVIATAKHYALNNQELDRLTVDVRASERAMHELYFPAFRESIRAGAWSVMASYNLVNGIYAVENPYLLTDILKERWGFRGFVVSDWGAAYASTPKGTMSAGLDLEMPSPYVYQASWIHAGLSAGDFDVSAIDEKVRRILRATRATGTSHPAYFGAAGVPQALLDAHRAVALEGAREGIVLLRNRHTLLPLSRARIHKLAVIGPNAAATPFGGGGSSLVKPWASVNILEGMRGALAATRAQVVYASGESVAEAVQAAKGADAVIVAVGMLANGDMEGEGVDRASLDLPADQVALIRAVTRVNRHAIVTINSGGMTYMQPWLDETGAVLQLGYAGQEGGRALAEIVFGDVNPSGKLTASYLHAAADSWVGDTFPGPKNVADYREGIYVGYRHLQKNSIRPEFAFGFGLSYTQFTYSDLRVDPALGGQGPKLHFRVKNAGARAGAEVAQAYVGAASTLDAVDRPVRQLKGAARVELAPGESHDVEIALPADAFAYYDESAHDWRTAPGVYRIWVGGSSEDLPLEGVHVAVSGVQ